MRKLESYIKKTIKARRARKKAAREHANKWKIIEASRRRSYASRNKLKRPYGIGPKARSYRRKQRKSNRRTRGGSCGCGRKKTMKRKY